MKIRSFFPVVSTCVRPEIWIIVRLGSKARQILDVFEPFLGFSPNSIPAYHYGLTILFRSKSTFKTSDDTFEAIDLT